MPRIALRRDRSQAGRTAPTADASSGDAALHAYQHQRVRIGIQSTLLVLVLVAAVLFLMAPPFGGAGSSPALVVLLAAGLGAILVTFVPWARLLGTRIGTWLFYAWSVFDVLLITLGIEVTGGGHSDLFFLYALTTITFAIVYTPRGQAVLLGLTLTCYLATVGAGGWDVVVTELVLRVSVLLTLAFLGRFLSGELISLLSAQYEIARRHRELDELKSDFLSTVSHELRTPLTAIKGFATTLSRHWDRTDDDLRRDLVGRIGHNASDLDYLISQLLDFSRSESGTVRLDVRRCELLPLVEESVERLSPSLGGSPISVDVPAHATALADPVALTHVIDNLVSNAAKFSPTGSPIAVRAALSGPELVVSVEDRGIGVPAGERERIFERFYRVDRGDHAREGGTGIGLAIARSFVEAQAGRIWMDEREGGGSVFTFAVPRVERQNVHALRPAGLRRGTLGLVRAAGPSGARS